MTTAGAPAALPPGARRTLITICAMSATIMQALDTTIANVALPYMQGTLGASMDQINWVLTSYIVAAAIMTAPIGWLANRFGTKKLFIICVVCFTLASMLCGIAQSIEQMVLFRLLQGMGGAALVPGNITPVAEANIANDADAAAEVFAADWFITMVPLDVTMPNVFLEHHRQALIDSGRPVAVAVGHMLDHYFEFYVGVYGHRASALHDPLAVAIALGDLVLTSAPVVRVLVDDTAGPGRGQTICDLRGIYNGFPEQSAAHTRVVLSLEDDFAPTLLARLLLA